MNTPKPISRPTHGLLDYVVPLGLFVLPRVLGWTGAPRRVLDSAAGVAIAYSLMTNYERGVWRKIPMRGHLALDAMHGTALAAAGAALAKEKTPVRATLAALGASELLITALTDPKRF